MNKDNSFRIPIKFEKIAEYDQNDERFVKIKIKILHLGLNFNGSIFEKDVVDAAIPTLGYIPITGFLENNSDGEIDFSDHRYVYLEKDGEIVERYMGVPYGVIMSNVDNNARYEDGEDDEGNERTYLVVDGLLWSMYDTTLEIFDRDTYKSQSMELWFNPDTYDGYEDDNGYYHFTKFSFRAACILGGDHRPAMSGSIVSPYFSMNDFVNNFQKELINKYEMFFKISNKPNSNNELATNLKRGGSQMSKKDKQNVDFEQTVMQQFEDIQNIVQSYEEITSEGYDMWKYPRYYAVDIQNDEVIVIDRKNNYNYYGLKFTNEGDKPIVDFDSAVRKKITYENYAVTQPVIDTVYSIGIAVNDIENQAKVVIDSYKKSVEKVEENLNTYKTNYTQLKSEYDEIKSKYENYVKAEQERINAEIKTEKENVIQTYENVIGLDSDFVNLKSEIDKYSVDEIKNKCAVIHSNKILEKVNFSKINTRQSSALEIDDNLEFDNNKNIINSDRYGTIIVNK